MVSCSSAYWLQHDKAKTSFTLSCEAGGQVSSHAHTFKKRMLVCTFVGFHFFNYRYKASVSLSPHVQNINRE